MRGEKTAPVLPEERPELFPIRVRQWKRVECRPGKKLEAPLFHWRWELGKTRLEFVEKHEPVGGSKIAMFTHNSREVQFPGSYLEADLFEGFTTGTGVGGFSDVGAKFTSEWAPESAIRFLGSLHQQDLVLRVESVDERRDFVGQVH